MIFLFSFIILLFVFTFVNIRHIKKVEKELKRNLILNTKQLNTESIRKLNEAKYNLEILTNEINAKLEGGN